MPTFKDATGRWRFRFMHKGRRFAGSAPKGYNTKRSAEALEKQTADRVVQRKFLGAMPTLVDFSVKYLAHQKEHTKPLKYELDDTVVRLHVLPYLGRKRLDEITKLDLDEIKTSWQCAPRTKNTRLGILQRMLALAVEWDYMTAAPTVKLLKIARDNPRFLTEDEANRLLEAADTARHSRRDTPVRRKVNTVSWRTMMLVGLRAGLRVGELRGLQWGDVSFERNVIMVRRTDPGRPDLDANAPKGNRPRTVPMAPDVVTALRDLWGKSSAPWPAAWVWPSASARHEDGVSHTRSTSGCQSAFAAARRAAGLDKDVSWHTLRHTFASWLVMHGMPLSVLQELLGHASIKQTERYAHLAPGFAQHAAIAMLALPPPKEPT